MFQERSFDIIDTERLTRDFRLLHADFSGQQKTDLELKQMPPGA
jgi:hypothetical protein